MTTEHTYTVPARTAEEAVDIAEDLYNDGDMGTVDSFSIDTADAISGENIADAEDFELEETEYNA